MKRIIVILLLCSFLSFNSCTLADTTNVQKEIQDVQKNYVVDVFEYSLNDCDIKINYPEIDTEDSFNSEILKYIEEYILCNYGEPLNGLKIDGDFEMMFLDNEKISLLFTGTSWLESTAHPSDFSFTFNYDFKRSQIISLSDYIKVDEHLTSLLADKINSFEDENLKMYFSQFSSSDFFGWLSKCDCADGVVFSYFYENGVGLVFIIPHAIGDYTVLNLTNEEIGQ